jgi:hypothetical protein
MLASWQTDSKRFEQGYHRRSGGFFIKKGYYFRIFFFDNLRGTPSLFQLNTEIAIFYVHPCTYLYAWWFRFLDEVQLILAFMNESTLNKPLSLAHIPFGLFRESTRGRKAFTAIGDTWGG